MRGRGGSLDSRAVARQATAPVGVLQGIALPRIAGWDRLRTSRSAGLQVECPLDQMVQHGLLQPGVQVCCGDDLSDFLKVRVYLGLPGLAHRREVRAWVLALGLGWGGVHCGAPEGRAAGPLNDGRAGTVSGAITESTRWAVAPRRTGPAGPVRATGRHGQRRVKDLARDLVDRVRGSPRGFEELAHRRSIACWGRRQVGLGRFGGHPPGLGRRRPVLGTATALPLCSHSRCKGGGP
mmetsp:Transcript_74470/g.131619  ORF Transcript_74470/g.131619 Transcript_74470/m.131619 type:complete len:237 (+) Transcript_74470:479-1189(+)